MIVNLNKEEFEMVQSSLLHSVELEFLPEDVAVMRSLLANQFKETNNQKQERLRQVNYQDVEVPEKQE